MRAWLIFSLRALLPVSASVVALGAASGCTTEAVCFSGCDGVNGDGVSGKGGGTSIAGTPNIVVGGDDGGLNLGGNVNTGGSVLEDAGTLCDNVDLQTDVNNCGECGNVCLFAGAQGLCVKGKCELGECNEGSVDADGDPSNGCELFCNPTPDPTEICDGVDNDCNGVKDDGFDLATDPNNCGVCGHKCELLHASSTCQPGATAPACVVTTCEAGWHNVDGVDANGCEYQCEKTGLNGVACAPNDPNCGVERCDSVDNDCNGIINDGNEANGGPDGGQPCYDFDYCDKNAKTCKGECKPGISTCVGKALTCIPSKGPSLEVCDSLDNDCDGVKDNGFDLTKDPNNCGGCGISCVGTLPNAVGQCVDPAGNAPPACQILTCKAGFKDLNPALPGCEKCPKFPTSAETCNGIDDDCNGVVDDAAAIASQKPAVDVFCNNGRPLGTTPCAGTTVTCGGTSGWVCNYPAGKGIEVDPVTKKVRPVEAACDDTDGNCDGQKDEAFLNKGKDCSVGFGVCAATSKYSCTADKSATECAVTATATKAVDELCNGLDDDCDGQIDERVPVAGSQCYNGGKHNCLGYVDPMVKVGNFWIYTYEASRPDATATDPGIYDVRSCSKAGVLPWTSISQTSAEATCKALPTSVAGTSMRLCSETEWQTACLAGNAATNPVWSFSTTASPYDDLVCNDANAGIAGPWATANNNGQSQRCRTSTSIWDMSGNVAEWTNSCITVLGKQYCRVRGGSYLSQGPATACNFSFVLDVPDFLNFDLGFRCCSSVAP
jgi:hypothetical protein